MKHIYLIRHGETDANLLRYVPTKQEPLNTRGFAQAEVLAKRIASLDIDLLIASDFLRAQQTAQPIAALKNMPIMTIPAFGEVLEPTSIHMVNETEEAVVEHRKNRNGNIENPTWRQEDGENFTDIFARIIEAKKFLEESTATNILVTSHSFFLQMFVAALLLKVEKPTNDWFVVGTTFQVSNTGVTFLSEEGGHWRVITWNDYSHFAE